MTEAKSLILRAKQDLDSFKLLIKNNHLHEKSGLALHEGVEKTIKALLILNSIHYSRKGKDGHNLVMLFEYVDSTQFIDTKKFIKLSNLNIYKFGGSYDFIYEAERLDLNHYYNLAMELFNLVAACVYKNQ